MNILIFPGGTEIANEISSALKHCKEAHLFSASFLAVDPVAFQTDGHFIVPEVTAANFVAEINSVITRQKIDYLFPAHDEAIIELGKLLPDLACKVLMPPPELCKLLRYKSKTYDMVKEVVRIPKVFQDIEAITEYPVFVKPDRGQGSQGAKLVRNKLELEQMIENSKAPLIICENLPGEEITVDCFSDREKGLIFFQARTRERVRSGISNRSEIYHDNEISQIAEKLQKLLHIYGPWFFQLKRNKEGNWTLLEIGARIAGTMALNRIRGINFPLLTLYEEQRKPLSVLVNETASCIERVLQNRYVMNCIYQHVYVDLDDTIVVKQRLNTLMIAFLYQCIDDEKKITLLTRHPDSMLPILERYKLRGIFDDIFVLDKTVSKADFIKENASIFIDDSFSELSDVAKKTGIRVFHPSMIECLIDYKRL